jgi:hypothetical protein
MSDEMKPVAWPDMPDNDDDFSADIARKIIGRYQEIASTLVVERDDLALRAAVLDEALTNAVQMRRHAEAERDEFCDSMLEDVETLRKALEWYADAENWSARRHPSGHSAESLAAADKGATARAALEANDA